MGALVNQNDFTHGELSPKMLARTDLQIYMKGAKRIRNMVVIAQGGAKRRFGTKYITSITATTGQYRLGEFIFDDNNSYFSYVSKLGTTMERDQIKQKRCIEKNINLLTIPYTVVRNGKEISRMLELMEYKYLGDRMTDKQYKGALCAAVVRLTEGLNAAQAARNVADEAADVANFAMMIADNARSRPPLAPHQ